MAKNKRGAMPEYTLAAVTPPAVDILDDEEMAVQIGDLLMDSDMLDEEEHATGFRTFEDLGLLTNDKGIVVTMANGTKYEITVRKV